ncbi:2-polyprenylphenol 6-hydroxylase [Caulobacter mirabilis]|uniref:2-polyprenylphenol 6-hydroxylase n=1 Tax=Caulobacter mirabilis TaxID=69666 RepID=A0A2D2ASW3_9CAUL|nr:2-polyprenylphenol 6-hydroxylase [Caulobacter mirabilis]ATQ41081.1 2-polyprenylphenol 6-hydroxylase [Caulobacter mirabilis]
MDLAAFARLLAVGWTLIRADALIPREVDPLLPPGVRTLAAFLRLFSGRAARQGRPGERMARVLEGLGPVGIKLGQVLSTRADIFGKTFAQDLSHLKDKLPPFPTPIAKAEIERELGRPVESLFVKFSAPVAAASIAQAHEAWLADGRKVAVKVLRPGVEAKVAADGRALLLASRLMERFIPDARRLEPVAFSRTVIRALQLELDLRFEAAGASEMAEVMARDPYMRAPAVVWDGVGKRVLTLEWAEGVPLSDPATLDLPGLNRQELADNIIRAFLTQALDHGVFHADLHEGNLFVIPPAKLVAVDFGIVGRLGPMERRYLAEILYGFITRDYQRVARIHFDAGYVPAHHDQEAFAQALRAVGEPVLGRAASEVSMGRLLAQLFEITALFDMRLRPELVLLQKTMVTVEGVARRLEPDHDLWTAAEPVVRRWIARELGPVAQARDFAQEALRAVRALARLAEADAAGRVTVVETRDKSGGLVWFAFGAVASAAAAWLFWALA